MWHQLWGTSRIFFSLSLLKFHISICRIVVVWTKKESKESQKIKLKICLFLEDLTVWKRSDLLLTEQQA